MVYEAYADADYYRNIYRGSTVPEQELERRLWAAGRHIDSLTYNRIADQEMSDLTEFQREIIREVCCQQADFEWENADMIGSVISAYSLNGASIQFGRTWNVMVSNGVAMRRDTYQLLQQTGLCCRMLERR